MKVTLQPGSDSVSFSPFTLEIGPNNEVEHILSLLSMRYNTIDPTTLVIVHDGIELRENVTIFQSGIKDNDTLLVKQKRSRCCVLL